MKNLDRLYQLSARVDERMREKNFAQSDQEVDPYAVGGAVAATGAGVYGAKKLRDAVIKRHGVIDVGDGTRAPKYVARPGMYRDAGQDALLRAKRGVGAAQIKGKKILKDGAERLAGIAAKGRKYLMEAGTSEVDPYVVGGAVAATGAGVYGAKKLRDAVIKKYGKDDDLFGRVARKGMYRDAAKAVPGQVKQGVKQAGSNAKKMLVKQADGSLAWVAKKMRQGASVASKGRLKLMEGERRGEIHFGLKDRFAAAKVAVRKMGKKIAYEAPNVLGKYDIREAKAIAQNAKIGRRMASADAKYAKTKAVSPHKEYLIDEVKKSRGYIKQEIADARKLAKTYRRKMAVAGGLASGAVIGGGALALGSRKKDMEASLVDAVRQLEASLARHDFARARDNEGQFVGGNQASHEDMMLAYQQRQARLKKIAAAGAIGATGAAAFNPAVRGAVVNVGRKIADKSGMIGRSISRGIAARMGR